MMLLLGLACVEPPGEAPPVPLDLVNPFIGTGGPGFRVGSATPAAAAPFGLVKLGPDTSNGAAGLGALHCSGYYHPDDHIEGFSHTHMHGVGLPALGDILFMPGDGIPDSAREPEDWRQAFSHDDETAIVGRYDVVLADGTEVTLSATERVGVHRYRFPESTADPTLAIDLGYTAYGRNLGAAIAVDVPGGVVTGVMTNDDDFGGSFPIWFVAVFDTGILSASTWSEGEVFEGGAEGSTGSEVGAIVHLPAGETRIRVALSLLGEDEAWANLEAERPDDLPIESTVAETRAAWAERFEGWSIEGASDEEAAIYWTALYHLLLMPTHYGDADGRYVGFDGAVHTAEGWRYSSDLSLWDTYRTAHPAYDLFYPEDAADFAQSLLSMRREGGAFPRWPVARAEGGSMLGAPADIALADAIVKGVGGWEAEAAWPLLVAQARGEGEYPYNARPAVAELESLGFIPAELVGASVAWQLELSWADAALSQAAQVVGTPEEAAFFAWRARQYENLYDPEMGWFHARHADGTFDPDLDPMAWADEYTEGNAWQYLWLAPWDWAGLAALLGGEETARARLTQFFENAVAEGPLIGPPGYYWHGNEPDIHAAYLFALWGDPAGTRTWVRWIRETHYHDDPDGLAGNDDAGTLSAWYLFASAGFYPIAGTRLYVVGEPAFDHLRLPVPGGPFDVWKEGEGELVGIELNGHPLTGPVFDHGELRGGGTLVFRYE